MSPLSLLLCERWSWIAALEVSLQILFSDIYTVKKMVGASLGVIPLLLSPKCQSGSRGVHLYGVLPAELGP